MSFWYKVYYVRLPSGKWYRQFVLGPLRLHWTTRNFNRATKCGAAYDVDSSG